MNATSKKTVIIESILKGIMLHTIVFLIRMGRRLSEMARKCSWTSPSTIHWTISLCMLAHIQTGL